MKTTICGTITTSLICLSMVVLFTLPARPDGPDISTNVWPACSNASGFATFINCDYVAMTGLVKDARAAWCYRALEERCQAAGEAWLTNTFRPRWYYYERQNLLQFKEAFLMIYPSFINRALADGNKLFDGYFSLPEFDLNPGFYVYPLFPYLAFSNLTDFASLSFYTNTPWMLLDQHSNGWDTMRGCITNLQCTWSPPQQKYFEYVSVSGQGTNYSNALSQAIALFSTAEIFSDSNTSYGVDVGSSANDEFVTFYSAREWPMVTCSSGLSFRADCYIIPQHYNLNTSSVFDGNGVITITSPHCLTNYSGIGTNGLWDSGKWFGLATNGLLTSVLPKPATLSDPDGRGFRSSHFWMLWWNFRYK